MEKSALRKHRKHLGSIFKRNGLWPMVRPKSYISIPLPKWFYRSNRSKLFETERTFLQIHRGGGSSPCDQLCFRTSLEVLHTYWAPMARDPSPVGTRRSWAATGGKAMGGMPIGRMVRFCLVRCIRSHPKQRAYHLSCRFSVLNPRWSTAGT